MINSPWIAAGLTLLISLIWMRLNNLLAKMNCVSSATSRKIIHIGTGPLFVLCWLLFPDNAISRYLAAVVPFLIVLQLGLVGLGALKDDSSVKAMARSGAKSELLKGPLFYGILFVVITIIFWKTPQAIIALMILCGGDGLADLIGSRIKSPKIPRTRGKTILGSISMFLGGAVFSLTILFVFILFGTVKFPLLNLVLPVAATSLVCTLVEAVSPSDFDNITVPVTALALSLLLI